MRLRGVFAELADFYGFEPMAGYIIEDIQTVLPLLKEKILEERMPLIGKTRNGQEFSLRVSGGISTLRRALDSGAGDSALSGKYSFGGQNIFLVREGLNRVECLEERGLLTVGEEGSIAEAEMIQVTWKSFEGMGLSLGAVELLLNANGCHQCRGQFRSAFNSYLRARWAKLCRKCHRFLKTASTRVLACGEEKCKGVSAQAPQVLDFLCEICKKHLRGLLEFLDEAHIPYSLDPRLFREGSWLDEFVFEAVLNRRVFEETGEDAEGYYPLSTTEGNVLLAEGGRMSRVAEVLTGRRVESASFVLFLDTIGRILTKHGVLLSQESEPEVFLIQLGELAKRRSLTLMEMLRAHRILVREALGKDSIKSQLKLAERAGAAVALIMGQKEALDKTVIVRESSSGIQETVLQEKLAEFLKKRLKRETR